MLKTTITDDLCKICSLIKRLIKRIFHLKIDDTELSIVEYLRQCGAQIGENVDFVDSGCNFKDATCLQIGNNVTLSGTKILTHDASLRKFIGNNCNKIGRVVIGNNVFVGVNSVILPNVRIGNNVIIGSGSVVSKNIPDNSVAVGNPIRIICSCDEYIAKHMERMNNPKNVFWNLPRKDMTPEERQKFNKDIDGRIVYLCDSNQPQIKYVPWKK